MCVVCVCVCVYGWGEGAGGRGTESSFEKLQKVISADVKADVKQQEINLFLVYFMISYLTATTQPLDNQNIWQCVLTVLIKKTCEY